jgi:catechol 2,3-dioxygenase-like lactoylglutathione lyase family enzyme
MPSAPLHRIILYVRDLAKVAAFYEAHFGFSRGRDMPEEIELFPAAEGCSLLLLPASKGHRTGQSCVKLVFTVDDVAAFHADRTRHGLKFGVIHKGDGYCFANARDPAKNLVQISSRGHRPQPDSCNRDRSVENPEPQPKGLPQTIGSRQLTLPVPPLARVARAAPAK